jgi:hypothetical protein
MSKKTIAAALGFTALALAFSAGSYALRTAAPPQPGQPGLRANVPAAQLPAVALPTATKSAIADVISPSAAARFGITSASYAQARQVAHTTAGTLFLIPGSRGACLFLAYAVSCGDPGASGQPMLALLVKPFSSNSLVGGGISSSATTDVTIKTTTGRSVRFDSRDGTFGVTEASGFSTNDKVSFIAG